MEYKKDNINVVICFIWGIIWVNGKLIGVMGGFERLPWSYDLNRLSEWDWGCEYKSNKG